MKDTESRTTPADVTDELPLFSSAQLSYDELDTESMDTIAGHALTDKDLLIGVPFIITGVSFRTSAYGDTEYVSVEAVTKHPVGASGETSVVFNDGSSGIRRQVVLYLLEKGLIAPNGRDLSDARKLGDKIGDWSIAMFRVAASGETTASEDGESTTYTFLARIKVPHGLRKSEYTYTDPGDGRTKPATTFYLA